MVKITKGIYKARSRVAKALAHHTRLEIIDILAEEGERCVCELTERLDVSQSSVSKHLGVLKEAGLVDARKEGLNVTYFLRVPCVTDFFNCLDHVLQAECKRREEELSRN